MQIKDHCIKSVLLSIITCLGLLSTGCDFNNDLGMGSLEASGTAWSVEYGVRPIQGAVVSILEYPDIKCMTDEQGRYQFIGLASDIDLTFVHKHPLFRTIHTQTFTLADEDLVDVSFQVPNLVMFELLAIISNSEPDKTKGHIASTISTKDPELFQDLSFPGEPECTVTIEPPVPPQSGPIYFNDITWPLRHLTETTEDGGILFVNVPPGEYTVTAHKEGLEFHPIRVKVFPGVLTNAAPPHGLRMVR